MDSPSDIMSLCTVPKGRVGNFTIELTSRCNLRCQYCSVPQPVSYGAQDMSRVKLLSLLKLLSGQRLGSLSVSGRGELTAMAGWQDVCEELMGMGVPLNSVVNLAAPLSWAQAGTLSRFNTLHISIDSADYGQMKDVRKGADLKTILSNAALIRAAAFAERRNPPNIGIIAVATASNFVDLRPLAGLTVAIGASWLILQDLVMDYASETEASPARAVCTLSVEELQKAAANAIEAENILLTRSVGFLVWPSLMEMLQQATEGRKADIETVAVDSPLLGVHRRHAPRLTPGKTRFCTDPWDMLILLADGKTQPCCGGYESVADTNGAYSLDEIVNSQALIELRRRLLTGELDDYCRVCAKAGETTPAELRDCVANSLARS